MALLSGCNARGSDLLAHRRPVSAQGVNHASRLTDGKVASSGDEWNCDLAAVLKGADASVVYDLGATTAIRGGWLLADNDDTYVVSVSDDGQTFHMAWEAGPGKGYGLQPRAGAFEASGRYVQLQATGGDGSYSVSELQLFPEANARGPLGLEVQAPRRADEIARTSVLHLGLALMLAAALLRPGRRPWWALGVGALGLASWGAWEVLPGAWPLDGRGVSLARAVIATVATFVIGWDAFAPARIAPDRRVTTGLLTLCGALGVLAFYNLGHPQFYDDKARAPSFVHYLDLRQYYPTAKYFHEIGYRRIYEADLAAYLEETGKPFEQVAQRELRNLDTNLVEKVEARRPVVEGMRARFSPERWAAYVRDARFLRQTMNQENWFKTMLDLGGNATPVWMANAHLLFNAFEATDSNFFRVALLDVVLLGGMFLAIGRTFGLRAAALCMVLFGANDFIMFGTNWGGAIFRHDWLVCLGFGVCALATRRPALAGALFAAAASVRAFPGLALIGVLIPPSWALLEEALARRALPTVAELRKTFRPAWPVMLAAGVTLALLFAYSCVVLSPDAWRDWYAKVRILHADSHMNTVSLQALLAGETVREPVIAARRPLIWLATLGFTAAILLVGRKKSPHQAAVAALLLLPVLMNPSNYYLHLICLYPLLVMTPLPTRRPRDKQAPEVPSAVDLALPRVAMILTAMCASHYFAVMVPDRHIHFYLLSLSIVAGLAALLFVLLRRDGPDALEALTAEPRGTGTHEGLH